LDSLQLSTVHRQEKNTAMVITIDMGASENVIGRGVPQLPVVISEGSQKGVQYLVAVWRSF
jgi:hypothetical protein